MLRAFAFSALVLLTACPKQVTGPLSETTLYLAEGIENAPTEGRAASVAMNLHGHMREALKARGFKLVTNEAIPHDLTARLRVALTTDMLMFVSGSAHLVVEANGKVVDQIDVLMPAGHYMESVEQMSYYLSWELAGGLSDSPRVAQFAKGVRPSAVQPVVAQDTVTVPGTFATGAPQPNAWALIVGIESYRDAPAATGARADAEAFARLATTSLGIPEEHVQVAFDDRASRSDLEKHLKWLTTNVNAGDRVYVYFSGHGAPEPTSGTSYLLPYDGDPRALDETALKLSQLVGTLEASKSGEVLVMLDSCFSGSGGRSVLPAGVRPLVPVNRPTSSGRVALFTAASAAEISGPAPGGVHGLFTATVLEAIGTGKADSDGDGRLSLQELAQWVAPRVARQARRDLRQQNPTLTVGPGTSPASIVVTSGLK